MQAVSIEMLREEEVEELSSVILEVFNEFVPGDFLEEGITLFKEFISVDSLKIREEKGVAFTLVAKNEGRIIGTISIQDKDHIALFFVNKDYHGQGIGKRLFLEALNKIILCEERSLKKVTVNAWPNSVEVYKSLGFKEQGEGALLQTKGLVYLPMEMILEKSKE